MTSKKTIRLQLWKVHCSTHVLGDDEGDPSSPWSHLLSLNLGWWPSPADYLQITYYSSCRGGRTRYSPSAQLWGWHQSMGTVATADRCKESGQCFLLNGRDSWSSNNCSPRAVGWLSARLNPTVASIQSSFLFFLKKLYFVGSLCRRRRREKDIDCLGFSTRVFKFRRQRRGYKNAAEWVCSDRRLLD